MLAIFGAIHRVKHIHAFDADIYATGDRQFTWAMGTRFQGDQEIMVLNGMMSRSKAAATPIKKRLNAAEIAKAAATTVARKRPPGISAAPFAGQ